MKDYMKKLSVTVCAVSVSAMLAAASVYASADGIRPQPGTEEGSAYTTSAGDQAVTDPNIANTDTAAGSVTANTAANNVTSTAAANNTNKKYQSRLGGFLWFLLSVIVNFVLSCWVGNRFYKLAKRNAQGSSEIRALRKDIEEKFASTLKDISEPAIEVINQNESYARTDEGIAMPERRGHIELNEEERKMMRKWDARRASERASEEPEEDDEYYEEEAEERPEKRLPRSYQPTRRSSGIDFEDDGEIEEYDDEEEDEYEERRSAKSRPSRMTEHRTSVKKAAKKSSGKAKRFLDNVFPFDE